MTICLATIAASERFLNDVPGEKSFIADSPVDGSAMEDSVSTETDVSGDKFPRAVDDSRTLIFFEPLEALVFSISFELSSPTTRTSGSFTELQSSSVFCLCSLNSLECRTVSAFAIDIALELPDTGLLSR